MSNIVTVGDIAIGGQNPFALITGPCQLESLDHARMIAEGIMEACAPSGTKVIFKASYDKANRSSLGTSRGLGIERGLEILGRIREEFGVPVLTEVDHVREQASLALILVAVLTQKLSAPVACGLRTNAPDGGFTGQFARKR